MLLQPSVWEKRSAGLSRKNRRPESSLAPRGVLQRAALASGSGQRIEKRGLYSHLSSFGFSPHFLPRAYGGLIPATILTPIMDVLTIKDPSLHFVPLIFPIPPLLNLHPISTTVPPSGNDSSWLSTTPLTCQLSPSR